MHLAILLLIVACTQADFGNLDRLVRSQQNNALASLFGRPQMRASSGASGVVSVPKSVGGVPVVTFCNTTQTPLVINSYTITPDNIQPNEDVTITLYTTLKETVTSGTINEVAKVDGFPIINENYDLCTEIIEAGLHCPLAPANYDITQTLQIGSIPISGTVSSVTKMYDQNKNMLACIQVVVSV